MAFRSEEYLPARFYEIKEFYDFCLANNPEFENAEEIRNKGLNNRFPATADIDGIREWEKILNLTPLTTDTLDDRRFRILTSLQKQIPYTWSQLHKMMQFLCGDNYELKRDGDFILKVFLNLDSQSKLSSVLAMLEEVVPMHILIDMSVKFEAAALIDFACTGQPSVVIETPENTELKTANIQFGSPYIESAVIETAIGENNV